MAIIDAQLHDPAPWLDWSTDDEDTQFRVLTEITAAYLDAIGVAGVILFTSAEFGAAATLQLPERMAYVPSITPDAADLEAQVAEAKQRFREGLLGLRAVIGYPLDGTEARRLEQGVWDPVFQACEKHQVPLFVFISGWLGLARNVAARYPDLTIIIDHLGIRQPPMDVADTPPFATLPELLALAEFPNVGVKLCGLPALSAERFPFSDVVPQLRSMVDAFGADRLMWASDIGRFYGRIGLHNFVVPGTQGYYPGKHTYAESLNFIRFCDALTEAEKDAILGGTVSRMLGWPR